MLRRLLLPLLLLSTAAQAYTVPDKADDGWPVADASEQRWDTAVLDALEKQMATPPYASVTSVLVAQRGRLVYEHYANGGARDTLNDMRSATKTVTALLIGLAIDAKRIADDQAKAYAFFPKEAPAAGLDPRRLAITLQDLLSMSSVWECDDENNYSAGHEERMYLSEDWVRFALAIPVRGYAPWQQRPADSPYGRAFSYCTAGSFLLGAVVERATGKPLADFSREALEQPLGISAVQWNRSSEGTGMGGGGTRYRSRDVAKIGELLRDGGQWQGKRVVSERWITAMLTPRAVPRENTEYGYQIWRFRFPVQGREQWFWALSGNGGNYVFVSPELGLVAVVTSSGYNNRESHPRSQGIFRDYVLKALPPPRE